MTKQTMFSPLLKIDEVAQILHVHRNTVRRWSKQGTLHAYIINSRGDRRYHPGDIHQFLTNIENNRGYVNKALKSS